MCARELFIIAAPSGAGKTSLIKSLLKQDKQLCLSVSHTTRKPRPGERDGEHYHFVNDDRFKQMWANKEFIEHAQVFDHYYGTAKQELEAKFAQDLDVLLEIDWQGARQVRALFQNSIGIFILPPSRPILEKRLKERKQDSDETISRRMTDAVTDMAHYNEFEYVVINDDFNQALNDLQMIISARRLRCEFQAKQHQQVLKKLLAI